MNTFVIETDQPYEIINITEKVKACVTEGSGIVTTYAQHTSASIAIIDADPGTDIDFINFLKGIVPNVRWHHPHNPVHTPDHMLAGLLGPSETVPYENGELLLGAWQRIVLVELDGPQKRHIVVAVTPSPSPTDS